MNERLKQLIAQAGINLTPAQFSGVLEDEVDEFTLTKFAELIIADCIEIIEPCKCGCADDQERTLAEWYKTEIRSHFGVEK